MKKHLIFVAFLMSGIMISCDNHDADATITDETTQNEILGVPTGKIAYIEVDSLMTKYQFAKDFTEILTKKGENIQNTLAAKQRSLQQQAASMQKKFQSGGFTSEQEMQQAQQSLATQEQNLQELSIRLQTEFANEQEKYNKALRDSIQSFLRVYNKEKKYDYILSRAGDNILIANPHLDITQQVVKGLNKKYKPSDEIKEMLKNE